MNKTKKLSLVLGGIVVGLILYHVILLFSKSKTFQGPKSFGDMVINNLESTKDVSEDGQQSLYLERNGQLLCLIYQSHSGATEKIVFYKENNQPIFTYDLNDQETNTGTIRYGKMSPNFESVEGQLFIDTDLDGEFDLLSFRNKEGKVEKFIVLIEKECKLVTFLDFKEKYIKVEGSDKKIPMATSQRKKVVQLDSSDGEIE